MNGQMNASKKSLVENFIKTNNPCEKNKPLQFDLRGYATYVKTHNLKTHQITDEILNKFSKV